MFKRFRAWWNTPPDLLPPISDEERFNENSGLHLKYPMRFYCHCRGCLIPAQKSGYCRPHEIEKQRWKGLA